MILPGRNAAQPGDRAARARPVRWLPARVADAHLETRTARTLLLDVPGWPGHDAGQHVDVRLTAEDGYTAERSYSIASASAPDRIELTVQKVSRGEVSPYFVDTVRAGDMFELRGPLGGWFRWTDALPVPVLLVAGGSGIVPLMSMVRARIKSASSAPFHLIYSARTPDHVLYADELHRIAATADGVRVDLAFSRAGLPADARRPSRLRPADLPEQTLTAAGPTRVYVCGPTGFVEAVSGALLDRNHSATDIRTERFGPTGD